MESGDGDRRPVVRVDAITLRGVLRFAETVSIPLADLPPGLIAFTGLNGEGKSTMLEAPLACWYRTLPSRDKGLLDYTHATDAFIETIFNLDGRGLYRSRLSLDGPHKRAEGAITRYLPDGSEAFVTADSKVTTYDKVIEDLLPPLKLLLCSVFASQDRAGSFAKLDKKDRKALFARLFGLDHYEMLSERAREAAALVQQDVGAALLERQTRSGAVGEDEPLPDMANLVKLETAETERRAELVRLMDTTGEMLQAVQAAAAAHAATKQRRDALVLEEGTLAAARRRLQDRAAEIERVKAEKIAAEDRAAETDVKRLETALADTSEYAATIRKLDEQLAAVITDADTRIANNKALMDRGPEIRTAVKQVKEHDLAIRVAMDESVVEELEKARTDERQLADSTSTATTAANELGRATKDYGITAFVPCHGQGEYESCQFLTNAAAAKARLPELQEVADRLPALERELSAVRDLIGRLQGRQRRTADAIKDLTAARDHKKKLADKLPDLERAEAQIEGHQKRKTDAAEDHARHAADALERRQARDVDLRAQMARRDALAAERIEAITEEAQRAAAGVALDLVANTQQMDIRNDALTRVETELEATAGAAADAGQLQVTLEVYRREWDASTTMLATIKSRQEDLARRIAERAEKVAKLERLDARIKGLQAEQIEWQTLQKAFGRDGIPMLEIDAAGPTIAAYTNDLLATCGLGRFTVELVTQEAKKSAGKDGSTMKESFEIKVWDSERPGDTARDLGDLSGGEQVLVDEALKSAIALVANARNPHPIQTCWRDETTGALHPDVAPKYVTMLRRVHELGKFHQTIFITHNPDAALQADAQVHFAGGAVNVVLPPYEDAA
jgi:exonuclease SbcC